MEPVHISEIKNYLRCRLSWFWSAPPPRGLGLEPKVKRPSLHFGGLTHNALQVGYDTGRLFEEVFSELSAASLAELQTQESSLFASDVLEIEKQASLGKAMMRGYQEWSQVHDEDVQFLSLETSWDKVRIGRIPFAGRFDAVIKRADGIWILDFKTTKYSVNDWTTTDLQATAYVYAARKLFGPEVRGLIFRFLLKKSPLSYDKLILKNGSVTERKTISSETTYREYMLALAVATLRDLVKSDFTFAGQVGLSKDEDDLGAFATVLEDPEHFEAEWYSQFHEVFLDVRRLYHDQISSLRGQNHFFWEQVEYRTSEQIGRCLRHVLHPAAKEIVSRRKGRWVGPTGLGASFALCGNCQFKVPCRLVMAGADYRTILQEEYQLRDIYREVKK